MVDRQPANMSTRQTDSQTASQPASQPDRQTDRHTDKRTDIQAKRMHYHSDTIAVFFHPLDHILAEIPDVNICRL